MSNEAEGASDRVGRRVASSATGDPVLEGERLDRLVAWLDAQGFAGAGSPLATRFLSGGSQNETFIYSGGNDTIDGRAGDDTLSFANQKWADVAFVRQNGLLSAVTSIGRTTFTNIETFRFADGVVISLPDIKV